MSEEEELDDEDTQTGSDEEEDTEEIVSIERFEIQENKLVYLCGLGDGTEAVYDRSDLMDGGELQKMVLRYERRVPPPWDESCPCCEGEGCEECECPDCERTCRFLNGLNYGCPMHPVV